MKSAFRVALASLALLPAAVAGADAQEHPPQYLIVSFDGAQHVEQWQRSLRLARETGASFTYFLSCVYLIEREQRSKYRPPDRQAGRSDVGFAPSRDDVAARLDEIWTAHVEGHEIAGHGCGHFDGSAWSASQWRHEFGQFRDILTEAWVLNGLEEDEPAGWRAMAGDGLIGFRAPYLAIGDGLFAALPEEGYRYDASEVSQGPRPAREEAGVLRFALPMIPEGPNQRPIIAMDYNLFVRHSGGIERGDPDGSFEERTLAAFRAALDTQIEGDRLPLQLGFHFTLMNDGAYWRALERFAGEACARPEVRCVSYRDYLEAEGLLEAAGDG
jgi:peptidoglycan/xylan/chitin deacetylase (PgdA/CDA1 family)